MTPEQIDEAVKQFRSQLEKADSASVKAITKEVEPVDGFSKYRTTGVIFIVTYPPEGTPE